MMVNKSPAISAQLLHIRNDDEPQWTIYLDDCFEKHVLGYFDAATVHSMFRNLGGQAGDRDSMDVEEYSKYCSAIWHFRVIPDEINTVSRITAKVPVGEGPLVDIVDIVKDTIPWPRRTPEAEDPKSWCWDREARHSKKMSHQLANIGLVLGWIEVLKAQTENLIWDWKRSTGKDMSKTLLECLGLERLDGMYHNCVVNRSGRRS